MKKILISCTDSRIESNRSFYGCFELSALLSSSKSDSLTVANTLRRTLLSECTGVAIVSVIIENVHHEYSTLPGVRDSVLDILLNLKELVFKKVNTLDYASQKKLYSVGVQGYLKPRGTGVIRAKDLRIPSVIQCVDPEQYIATLGDDGFLNMQFVIQESSNVRHNKKNILPKGSETLLSARRLYIDAVFNPVTKVNYIIKDSDKRYEKKDADLDVCEYSNKTQTDVGVTQRLDTDILVVVWRNGSLHPREALSSAFLHLSSVFLLPAGNKSCLSL